MELFHSIINVITFILNVVGAIIIIWGIIISLIDFFRKELPTLYILRF